MATEPGASLVRGYAWTAGRTRSTVALRVETLVSISAEADEPALRGQAEYRQVADICRRPTSVAEVAALLSLPLGVAKVLLGDMAAAGLVVVHQTATGDNGRPSVELMRRVRDGLRRL